MNAVEESTELALFEGIGVEVEYMIVDRETLSVRPISDQLLHRVAGSYESEVEMGDLAWSNELVLHVIELKTNGPRENLAGLEQAFVADLRKIDDMLAPLGAALLPTAMHPLMDSATETRLWPHEYNEVYATFDRMFDCKGHGWANLQSVHINLPFRGDSEFGRLHAAIRLVLPILPALAASSPIADGEPTGLLDSRLSYYRQNCRRLPIVTGHVIPEACFSIQDYEQQILGPIGEAVAPFDRAGVLDPEWVNARGAIARFSRGSVEIRLLDSQECPKADLAVVTLVTALVRGLVEERWISYERQQSFSVATLEPLFDACVSQGDAARIDDAGYLAGLTGTARRNVTGGELWATLAEHLVREELLDNAWKPAISVLTERGCLARRILGALGGDTSRAAVTAVYRRLRDCLLRNEMFTGA